MDVITNLVAKGNSFLWSFLLIVLLCGTGIYYTIRLRFIQVRKFGEGWKLVFGHLRLNGEKHEKGEMSPFQSIATAIAAQVGTGNLAGAATALLGGGPGAIFWMWVSAFFGMSTIYAEATLAQNFKTEINGEVTGGPVYYIKAAFKGTLGKVLAGLFAIFIVLALGFMGNMVQSNSISDAFNTAFGAPKFAVGIVIAVIAAFIFLGGIGRIASFTEKVVPMMAAMYLIGSVIVLAINFRNLPGAVASIFIGAFSPKAVGGAVAGMTIRMAMRFGVARGLFSNEAGMGSTPHAHAMAKVKHPQEQGETAMVGVFLDTFIVLTVTALVILSSGVLDGMISNGVSGTPVAQAAFGTAFGGFGSVFVALCLLFFAFSTIIGWYFFAAANVTQLFGSRAVKPFSVIVVACIFLGSLLKVELVWNMSDLFNGLMVLPNLAALIALNAVVARAARGKKIERNLKEEVSVIQRPAAE